MYQERDSHYTELERELERLREENRQLAEGGGRARPKKGRSLLQKLLLGLGLAVLIPASLMLWLNRTVTTSEGYLKAVGPAIERPEVQRAIQKGATDAILGRVDVDQVVSSALPENAQFMAQPIAAQVKAYTGTTIGQIVSSAEFANLWVEVNRRAQQRFMDIAQNSTGDPTVDVSDLYGFVSQKLSGTRLSVLANRELPPKVGEITVATIPALERIPNLVSNLNSGTWILMLLALALLASSVWAAPNKRRALIWTGLGAIGATLITLAAARITRNLALAQIADPVYRDGALAIWQSIMNPLLIQTLVLSLLGLAVALTGWMFGSGRVASRIRSTSNRVLASGRKRVMGGAEGAPFLQFLRQHHVTLRWVLLVTVIILMLLNTPLTIMSALAVLSVGVVLLLVLEFLTAPDVPDRVVQ